MYLFEISNIVLSVTDQKILKEKDNFVLGFMMRLLNGLFK